MPKQPTLYLAQQVAQTSLADAPPEAVRIAKDTFLDTIGCVLAGSAEPGGVKVARHARAMGAGVASIVGTPARVSPFMAALANGTSAAILDYDDTSWSAIAMCPWSSPSSLAQAAVVPKTPIAPVLCRPMRSSPTAIPRPIFVVVSKPSI